AIDEEAARTDDRGVRRDQLGQRAPVGRQQRAVDPVLQLPHVCFHLPDPPPDSGQRPPSPSRAMAPPSVSIAAADHAVELPTTTCSIPRSARPSHRRANLSLDSPASSRVLSVFSTSAYGR